MLSVMSSDADFPLNQLYTREKALQSISFPDYMLILKKLKKKLQRGC